MKETRLRSWKEMQQSVQIVQICQDNLPMGRCPRFATTQSFAGIFFFFLFHECILILGMVEDGQLLETND